MSLTVSERMSRVMPSATSAVLGLAARLREEGKDVISLGAGEPDFDTPEHVKEAAIKAIRDGQTKYTAIDGTSSLKTAIQHKFERDNGLSYRHDEILVSCGAKHTLFNLCMGVLSAGDEAIIPTPYWVSYPDMVRVADGVPITIPTGIESGFKITPEQLEAAITGRTRMLFLNSPSNPSGSSYTRQELEALGEVLVRHPQIVIAADDIYEHIHWGDDAFCSLATAVPELKEQTVTINGVSKCYAMTGWRIGYAGGPAHVIGAMKTIQSQVTSNPCSISQAAAAAALNGDQACVAEMNRAYRERSDYIVEALNSIPGFECRRGEGAFYAFPRVTGAIEAKGFRDDYELVDLFLKEAIVVLVPGSPFGAPGYVRISFACSIRELEEAVRRMAAIMR
ncbi:MAG: pyridoxal phosphate-dependent aminotransferase [Gammaproteobacteria bacterium]|nr:pyridoxal phosphate-dependent aminotransferase [Gammaproteobacteria bacterium]MDH4255626.1 pyridoxal phosphate-dependent aminotransferase [Gammaproteobacteria bacterium]MDH5310850.1 pyridoxal phosphate-dependent aminotransferase [Gammaproteobacteria bacterium]